MSSHFLHLFKSTVRVVTDTIQEVKDAGIADAQFMNMDDMAEIAEWPNVDLIGMAQFSITFDDHLIDMTCAFGVSPYQDRQLLRHITIMDRLVDKLKPMATHPVFHADTGDTLGWMKVTNGTTVRGMERTESRPLQFIVASFVTSLTYQL